MTLHLFLFSALLVFVYVLVTWSPLHANAATNAAGALSYSAMQTRLCDMNLTTPHDSSAEDLAMTMNPMQYVPNLYAGLALPLSNRADYGIDMPIMLPHKDDDPTACAAPMRTMNEYGQTYENSFILMQQSRCSDIRFRYAGMSGARGLLVYGCSPDFPSNCDPSLQLLMLNVQPGNVTLITITYADGIRIVNYLKQKHAESGGLGAPRDTLVATLKSSAPIVPEEKAALIAIMSKMTMSPFAGNPALDLLPYWTLALFNTSSFDPCRNRVKGLWCEGPNVVIVNMMYHFWKSINVAAGIPTEFGAFTEMRFFSVHYNTWVGALPQSFCQMTKLRVLWLAQQFAPPGITSVPACDWPDMEEFWVEQNSLTALPIAGWTKLKRMSAQLISARTLPSLKNLPYLEFFDISQNQIVGAGFPDFHPNTKNTLKVLAMGNNKYTGAIANDTFDGYSALEILDINSNRFTGSLPTMKGCSALKILDLSNQRDLLSGMSSGFTGSIPKSWYTTLSKLQTLSLQVNSLVTDPSGPMSFQYLQLLQYLDVSNNFLTLNPYTGFPSGLMAAWLSEVTGVSLITIRASYNNFSGPFRVPDAAAFMTLRNLYLDHNKIQTTWVEIFTSGVVKFDISYNDLSPPATFQFMTGAPTPNFQYMNFQGNPKFIFPDSSFPKWLRSLATNTLNVGDSYSCSSFKADSAPEMTFLVDPAFYNYKYCTCIAGKFGKAPLCSSLPNNAQLNPFTIISSDEVGSTFPTLLQQTGGVGSNLIVNTTQVPSAQVAPNMTAYKQSFSDAMYGENRLTQGLVTSWSIDLTDMYSDDIDQILEEGGIPLSTQSIYHVKNGATPQSTWTPIRVITVRLHISNSLFVDFNDALSVFTGGKDFKGTRVFTLRGTDDKPLKSSSAYTETSEYQALYGADLAKIDSPSLIEVQVFAPSCAVQFTSRVSGGLHFYATYSYDFQCPQGYFYDEVTDPASPKCRENYALYSMSQGIRSAVFAVSAISLAFIVFTIIILVLHWENPVFKAASRAFMLLILVLLVGMTLGAMLYAAIPMLGKTGNAVCSGRAWLTCLPLAGVLAVLLAKNRRLWLIFGATKLQIKTHSDTDILISVLLICSLQAGMLAIFSALPLSRASLELGHGSLADKLVRQCSHETGFMSWIGAEIGFIAALMLPTAYLGFKTRNLPSQYNESAHLQNALLLLMFFGVIIIPLDIFIQDEPVAAVLIQGLGQAFLTLVLTAIIFGPKLYFVLAGVATRGSGGMSIHKPTATNHSVEGTNISSLDKSSSPPQTMNQPGGTSPHRQRGSTTGGSLGIVGGATTTSPSTSKQIQQYASSLSPKSTDQRIPSARKAAAYPSSVVPSTGPSHSPAPAVSVAPIEDSSSLPQNVTAADELNAVHRANTASHEEENTSPAAIEMVDVGVTIQ